MEDKERDSYLAIIAQQHKMIIQLFEFNMALSSRAFMSPIPPPPMSFGPASPNIPAMSPFTMSSLVPSPEELKKMMKMFGLGADDKDLT